MPISRSTSCKYDNSVILKLHKSEYTRTRGNFLKLKTERADYDLRKKFFCCRITKAWNSLPDEVVTAESINSLRIGWISIGHTVSCIMTGRPKNPEAHTRV